jgi:hypothetical protein
MYYKKHPLSYYSGGVLFTYVFKNIFPNSNTEEIQGVSIGYGTNPAPLIN